MLELRVHRWQHALGVPRHWSMAQSAQAARDVQAHTEEIAGGLARAIEPWLDDEAVIVLPRVAIDAHYDPRNDWHVSCGVWAQQLARQFAHALGDPACGAVRFASRAEYAARYVAALARGSADRWWFTSFAGLRALPASAAIRTVLTRDDAPGFRIVAALDDGESRDVARALGADEAMRVLAGWCEASPPDAVPAVAGLLDLARLEPHEQAPVPYVALRALALRAANAPPTARDAAALLVAAALARAAQNGGSRDELRAVTAGDDIALSRWCETGLAGARRSVTSRLDDATRSALRSLATEAIAKARAPAMQAQASYDTAFGGVAWLLYAIHDFLADAIPRMPWPRLDGAAPTAAISLAVVSAAWLPARSLAIFHDEAWRALLGIERSLDEQRLQDFLCEADAAANAWASAWPAMLSRWGRSALIVHKRRHVDRDSGLWLTEEVADGLPQAEAPDFATRLALARGARREAQFLDRNEFTDALPVQWQCLLRAAAQAALRRLAYRIPGMAWTSPAHLHANVLDVRARVHVPVDGSTAWRVQLARPPLDVLMSMTGLARVKYDVLPGRAVVLSRLEG